MAKSDPKLFGDINFGIAIKLGILLAAFGVLASGLTGYYTFQATRDILIREASQDLLHSTQVLGRRFSIMAGAVANDARFLAQLPRAHDVFGTGHAAKISRQSLSEEFKSLLSVHPEYFQARFISAVHNGIELIRVDRDANSLRISWSRLMPIWKRLSPSGHAIWKVPIEHFLRKWPNASRQKRKYAACH